MKRLLFMIVCMVLSVLLTHAEDQNDVFAGWAQMDIKGDELKEIEPSRTYIYRVAATKDLEEFMQFEPIMYFRSYFEFRYNTKKQDVIQLVMIRKDPSIDFIFNKDHSVMGKVGFYDINGKLFKKYTIAFQPTVSKSYLLHKGQVAREICEFINNGKGRVRFVLPTNMIDSKGNSDFDLYVPSHWLYTNKFNGGYVIKEEYEVYLDLRL